MRLRQIKIAGFKSFVDPTEIDVPGTLVGVVGPNGCGKSNVIDAVRWVLGESKATELRGESMQDVIFNGTVNRKPGGRASVELSFENNEGRITGEWGKFSEIAVKRVLTRDGTSIYYINNQSVRRRDVQDMFMGTGLGPRAYAIIGQGMISRIIEARPDELRIFLEEAAGVSKYKERRRETENRLADTRDNLTRVEDILRELEAQAAKLEQQAEVAQRYHALRGEHDGDQQLLWYLRRRDATNEAARVAHDIAARTTAIQEHIAALRGAERRLEEARAAHYAASDAAHAAHGALLEVNAEIGKLETEVRMIADSRARMASQVDSQLAAHARRLAEHEDLTTRAADLQRHISEGELKLAQALSALEAHGATLPGLEEAYRLARDAMGAARTEVAMAEQAIEGTGAQQRAIDRQLSALTQRRERMAAERAQMGLPDESRLAALQADVQRCAGELKACTERQQAGEAALAGFQKERQSLIEARTRESDAQARLEARLHALRELQSNVEADAKLDPWLSKQGLENLPRLFKKMHVDAGWEIAFEAILRERIEGLEVGRIDSLAGLADDAPPARVSFYAPQAAVLRDSAPLAGFAALTARIRGHDAQLAAVLGDWLANVYEADGLAQALAARAQLPPGGQFVVKSGHLVSRYGVRFYAADDRKAGLLARRQEIENIDRELRAQKLLVEQAVGALAKGEAQLRQAQEQSQAEQRRADELRSQLHAAQLEAVRLEELIGRVRHRSDQIETELAEINAHESELLAQRGDADGRFEALDQDLAVKQEHFESARVAYEASDQALRSGREEQQRLGAERQRHVFELGAARDRASDVAHALTVAVGEAQRLAADVEATQAELARLDDSAVRSGLDAWLGKRSAAETGLREARSHVDEIGQQQKAFDEERMKLEQELQPKRDKITELQLKEQAAHLAAEQFELQLAEAKADEAALVARLAASPVRANALQAEILRLAQEIEALGAVNMAALDELNAARERKGFLDAQNTDLKTAVGTLEDAIRKIDRETRDMLQSTFDAVNGHFGTLFPRLFGGGEARLLMTGEEILDAGVQVMAQPPGKRNSSIHLLSGGEKALTAIALVFALFKLNPAPFCLLDEVDAPLDDANTDHFCELVRSMTSETQFLFITHNKIAMEMAEQLIGVTMQEQGVSRIVAVDIDNALKLTATA